MRFKSKAIFDGGLNLPISPVAGRVLTSDGVGDAAWASLPAGAPTPVVSALPGSPVDGQEIYFQDTNMAAANVMWHLRYRAAISDAFKWEYLGGGSLQDQINTVENVGTANTWVNLATNGPQVTCPLAGIYTAQFGTKMSCGNRGISMRAGLAIGDTSPTSFIAEMSAPDSGAPYASAIITSPMSRQRFSVAASNIIKHRYYSGLASGGSVYTDRWLDVTPMRVG